MFRKNPMREHRGKNRLVRDAMLKIAKNHLTKKSTDSDLAHLLDYGLCHQNKTKLPMVIFMFFWLFLVVFALCGVTFRTLSHHKTQKQPRTTKKT